MTLRFKIFDKYPELVYGYTEKKDGSMKLFDVEKRIVNKIHRQNKKKYFSKLGINLNELVGASLIGGNDVRIASKKEKGKIIDDADALVTYNKNIFLTITVADCFPVYFFEPNTKIIALAHAGWRGVAKNIVIQTLKKIDPQKELRKSILVGIGPGIKSCCYDIEEKFLKNFKKYPKFIFRKNNKVFIDLLGIIKLQLLKEGIFCNNIELSKDCTYCLKDKYFS